MSSSKRCGDAQPKLLGARGVQSKSNSSESVSIDQGTSACASSRHEFRTVPSIPCDKKALQINLRPTIDSTKPNVTVIKASRASRLCVPGSPQCRWPAGTSFSRRRLIQNQCAGAAKHVDLERNFIAMFLLFYRGKKNVDLDSNFIAMFVFVSSQTKQTR